MALFNDITLGHYYAGDSIVHRLDPRTKLIALLVMMTSLLVSFHAALLLVFAVLSLVLVFISRLPFLMVFRNLRPFFWLFLLTLVIHMFWTPGQRWFSVPWTGWTVTLEGVRMGLIYSLRLALLIVYAAMLTLTTSPIELTDALEKLLNPLKKFKVPAHEIVMMLTLSLRFIPTLMEEAERIKKAQLSRGATFEGNLIQRLRNVIPLVLPLFVSAFRRADELALAMDSRCYAGGEGRTSYTRLSFTPTDYVVLMGAAVGFVISLIWG